MKATILLKRSRLLLFPIDCACCGTPLETAEANLGVCEACMELLIPESGDRCRLCGRPLVSERDTCVECRELPPPTYDRAYALFRYGGLPRRFLSAYKFGTGRAGAAFIAELFSQAMEAAVSVSGGGFSVVPVPPRPGKLKELGWDQVAAVAKRLERAGRFPVERCLERLPSKVQKKLDRRERAANMRGVIRCSGKAPRRAVLIDDVITTGATLNAGAEALKKAGCEYVFALALCYD